MCGNLHKSGKRNLYSQGSCLFPSPPSVTLCGARYQRQLVSGFVGQYFQLMCFCATIQNLKHPLTHTHHTPIHTPIHTHVLPKCVCVRPSPLVHYLMYLTFVVVALPASIFGGANKPQSTSTCTSVCVYQCVWRVCICLCIV